MKTETILFDTIPPYFAPVSLADLLTEIEAVIKRHVILSDHAAAALAVWVLHTYTFELRDTVAYVAIESPEKRCGKTTLLSVLAAMAHRPLISSNITVGALFRAIHNCSPTLFIDEADTFLAGNSIMRGIINSGNTRRTAYVLRLVGRAYSRAESQPAQIAPESLPSLATNNPGIKKFSCWCPKVISMIGEGPAASQTLKDSAINEYQISKKLRYYGVKPSCIRIGKVVRNGYLASDFREALKRYVTREAAEARMDGAYRRAKLQQEAQAEALKEQDLINQVMTSAPRDRLMTLPEVMAKLRELQKSPHNKGNSEAAKPSNS